MSVEALIAAIVEGGVVYALTRNLKNPKQTLAENQASEIDAKLRIGGIIDKRDFFEKARAEIRRAPGVSTEWLYSWKEAKAFNVLFVGSFFDKEDIERLEEDARERAIMALKAEYPEAFQV